jgi:hypothetical protein
VGALLALGGMLATYQFTNPRDLFTPILALTTGLVTVPGVLYLAASVGLVRRRYWAWVMSFAVTVLLIVALVVTFGVIAVRVHNGFGFLVPGVLYVLMPCLILAYMLRALPVVREAELLGAKGFNVLPARPAGCGDDQRWAEPALRGRVAAAGTMPACPRDPDEIPTPSPTSS